MAELKEVLVPDVGGDEVEVIELCVAVGDAVEAEDALITVESDKASMDIPAPFAGTVKEIKVNLGDKVSEGSLIVMLESGAAAPAQASQEEAPAPQAAPAASPAPAAGGNVVEVHVPDIGEDGEVDVIEVLVAPGDVIEAEAGLITLETDKATMDVPAPMAGTVKEVKVATGDKVSQGSLVLLLETGAAQEAAPAVESAPAAAVEAAAPAAPAVAEVKEVHVPDIGEDGEVDVIDVLASAVISPWLASMSATMRSAIWPR